MKLNEKIIFIPPFHEKYELFVYDKFMYKAYFMNQESFEILITLFIRSIYNDELKRCFKLLIFIY